MTFGEVLHKSTRIASVGASPNFDFYERNTHIVCRAIVYRPVHNGPAFFFCRSAAPDNPGKFTIIQFFINTVATKQKNDRLLMKSSPIQRREPDVLLPSKVMGYDISGGHRYISNAASSLSGCPRRSVSVVL